MFDCPRAHNKLLQEGKAKTSCWITGFRQGDSVWHVRVEFHLPGVEWPLADPTNGNSVDPTGAYAHDFGYVPNADSFLGVD